MKKEILEGNKLIAEFMGLEEGPEYVNAFDRDDLLYFTGGGYESAKYDSSWDWLMPVVEKIECLSCTVTMVNNACCIFYTGDDREFSYSPLAVSKIEAVWLAVVEFIKWYNKETK
jgi:hypothetical protein